MALKRSDISIDEDFRQLHRQLTALESAQLEANIRKDGRVLDPIAVWNGKVLDGHNRLEKYDLIAAEDPSFPEPPFESLGFKDRGSAIDWICRHQYGRRNLTPKEMSYLRGKWAEEKASENGSEIKGQNVPCAPAHKNKPKKRGNRENGPRRSSKRAAAARSVAAETGTDEKTVRRDMTYAAALDEITTKLGSASVAQDIKSGKISIAKKRVVELAGMTADEIRAALAPPERNGKPSGGPTFNPSEWEASVKPEHSHLKDALEAVDQFKSIMSTLSKAKGSVHALSEHKGGARLKWQDAERLFDQLRINLKAAMFEATCPDCKNKPQKSCQRCSGLGWICHGQMGQLSEAHKEWLKTQTYSMK